MDLNDDEEFPPNSELPAVTLFWMLPRKLRAFAFSLHEGPTLTIVACAEDGTRREVRDGEVVLCG